MHYLAEQVVYDQESSSADCTFITKTMQLVPLNKVTVYSENCANPINNFLGKM
jgi:hypothetical protein